MPRLINLQRACLFYWRIYCSSNNCQRVRLVKGLELHRGSITWSASWQPSGSSFVTNTSTWVDTLDQWTGNLGTSFLGQDHLFYLTHGCECQAFYVVGVIYSKALETDAHGFDECFMPARRGESSAFKSWLTSWWSGEKLLTVCSVLSILNSHGLFVLRPATGLRTED